ncbi:MAG: PAS domain-containing sensor histidine kinase [Dehalococcoidales bacterium]|nr:PAS domain-containing sensor histidine kinase [Dehalococcoidales bacterium]
MDKIHSTNNEASFKDDSEEHTKLIQHVKNSFYDIIIQNSLEAFFILDMHGNYIEVNEALCDMFGYSRKEMLTMTIMDTDIELPTKKAWLKQLNRIKTSNNQATRELRKVKNKDGSTLYFQTHNKCVSSPDLEQALFYCFGTNVTDLVKQRESLELLNRRCINAQEKERLRIARDLHDLLTQGLIVVRMEIISFLKQIEIQPFKIKMTEILGLIDQVLDDIQNISKELRPQNLDAFGLIKSIQLYVDDFEKHNKIKCRMKINNNSLLEMNITKEISITAYRILQEALLNIVRHSMATNVVVTISCKNDILRISINDNGCGMNSDVYRKKSSLGILGMYERVSLVSGKLMITSKPGKGTEVDPRNRTGS